MQILDRHGWMDLFRWTESEIPGKLDIPIGMSGKKFKEKFKSLEISGNDSTCHSTWHPDGIQMASTM